MQIFAQTAANVGFFDQLTTVWLAQVQALFGANGAAAVAILKIIGINIVLSGDNAVVIALACRNLPDHQRRLGVALGAGAAILLRILFTLVVQQLLDLPFLKLIGGIMLLWIAVKLLLADDSGEEVAGGATLWEAIKIISIADIIMSLDNVLAIAAAAKGDTWLMIAGLIISIPMVVFGSTMIIGLLRRYPLLVWVGAALLGWIAGELIATEPAAKAGVAEVARIFGGLSGPAVIKLFEVIGAALVVLAGWSIRRVTGDKTASAHAK
jgi:YjbE family integral membrane protein